MQRSTSGLRSRADSRAASSARVSQWAADDAAIEGLFRVVTVDGRR